MKTFCIFLALLAPAFAQQTNSNIVPASPGLNIGTPTQRWNGNFDTINANKVSINGGPTVGAGFGLNFAGLDSANVYSGTNIFNGAVTFGALTSPFGFQGAGQSTLSLGDNTAVTVLPAAEMTFGSLNGVAHLWFGSTDHGQIETSDLEGVAGGIPSLDNSGLVPCAQLGTNGSACNDATKFLRNDGTWNVPGGGGGGITGPACSIVGASDTITAAGLFAATCSLSNSGLAAGSFIEIRAHGLYTTTATASPLAGFKVDAGGMVGICSSGSNINPALSKTNAPWEVVCYIQIATTGNPGTATVWGQEVLANPNGGGVIGPNIWQPGTLTFVTTSAQNVRIEETATLVAGQSFTLSSLVVRNY